MSVRRAWAGGLLAASGGATKSTWELTAGAYGCRVDFCISAGGATLVNFFISASAATLASPGALTLHLSDANLPLDSSTALRTGYATGHPNVETDSPLITASAASGYGAWVRGMELAPGRRLIIWMNTDNTAGRLAMTIWEGHFSDRGMTRIGLEGPLASVI